MTRPAPIEDVDENDLQALPPKKLLPVKAVTVAMERGSVQASVARTVRSMLRVN